MALRKKFKDVELYLLNESAQVIDQNLENKTIKMDLSRQLRGRGLEITFKISNQDEKLIGYPKKFNLMKSYIRRMMRKRVSYVEDSFKVQCRDIRATMKPFLITRKKVSRAVRNNLRKTSKEFLIDYAKDKDYLEIANDIFTSGLQKELQPKLKRIYPLSFCEIRVFETSEIEKAEKPKTKKVVKAKEDTKEVKPEEKIVKAKEEVEEKEVKKKVVKKETKKVIKKETKPKATTKKTKE